MARRKDQEGRRAQIAAATERAVLNRGLADLRLRDIADEAGLTSGAVLYYYEAVEDLLQETYRNAIDRFCRQREHAVDQLTDARDRLRTVISTGVATGPEDTLPRLLFEFWPMSLRDPRVAALDNTLTERQIAVYYGVFVLGEAQGHFHLTDTPRQLAENFVGLEDGRQMDVLSGRLTRTQILRALHSQAKSVTGCNLTPPPPG
ncbi:TetR/AcrR family transcriptional regulator [Embleya sp. NBC_00896]|uniref:TetR/AcrR family transcriptional regulator n=1 Tax=Embleya sp. NBC_00896 TaxID=2975961 RepID=UPI003865DD51|nr:TetR family transcriptional regulator C-terminal domain-containing protein [Embleya sp. NBC_00896]